jgi:DNA-directed RNA polymerase specialized sigma24 family protein
MSRREPSLARARPRGTQSTTARQREAHRMRYVENRTTEEIAKHFGVTEACVQNWYTSVDAALADERNLRAMGIP